MNCSACGTTLLEEETYCSRCGEATPHYYVLTRTTPNDSTVVSVSGRGVQHRSTGFDSSLNQSPYEPYNITPSAPPPLQRGGKRRGMLVGIVLLVLLLIGGGVFAWRVYSAPGKPAAPQYFTAQGTATELDSTTTTTRQDGNNQISHITQHWVEYGDVTGQFTNDEIVTTHADKTADFTGTSTCTCTVSGKSGTLTWSYTGTQAADGNWQGQSFNVHGAGDLAKLHGQGNFHGQGVHNTYSSKLYFDS